jgi:hypothetical protein
MKSTTAIAKELGVTLEELLELNPDLLTLPFVPIGSVVNYYSDD